MQSSDFKFIDIGANMTNTCFTGIYNGKRYHENDFDLIVSRAKSCGVEKIFITGTDLEESKKALELCKRNEIFYATIGCHPTCTQEMDRFGDPQKYLQQMLQLYHSNPDKIIAFGECGLDYDRLHFSPKETQLRNFQLQLECFSSFGKPFFFHMRNAGDDFISLVQKYREKFVDAVVHCFTGTLEEAQKILELDLYIGITGCSLKSDENTRVVENLPIDRILLETDSPWCEIKKSFPSYHHIKSEFASVKKEKWTEGLQIKGRQEPCNMRQLCEMVAGIKGLPVKTVADVVYQTTRRIFRV